jgi:CO/xanthine dehydrogenase Mo-binding subunit
VPCGRRIAPRLGDTGLTGADIGPLIELEYEELPGIFEGSEALAPDALILHEDSSDYRYLPMKGGLFAPYAKVSRLPAPPERARRAPHGQGDARP